MGGQVDNAPVRFSGVSRAWRSPRQRALAEGFYSESHAAIGLQPPKREETQVLGFGSTRLGMDFSCCRQFCPRPEVLMKGQCHKDHEAREEGGTGMEAFGVG